MDSDLIYRDVQWHMVIRYIDSYPVGRIEGLDSTLIAITTVDETPISIANKLTQLRFQWDDKNQWWVAPYFTKQNYKPVNTVFDSKPLHYTIDQLSDVTDELYEKYPLEGRISHYWASLMWAIRNTQYEMNTYNQLFDLIPANWRDVSKDDVDGFLAWVLPHKHSEQTLYYDQLEACLQRFYVDKK